MFVSAPATCSGGYEQRAANSQALNMMIDLRQTRRLMLEQQTNSLPRPFLTVIVSWITIIFISFGLQAPRNATFVVVLFVCVLSVSAAIFLILELYPPFAGVIRISSAPLRNALVHLGQQKNCQTRLQTPRLPLLSAAV